MKVFISGKMTGEPNYNREKFNAVEAELKEKGFIVLNPAVLPDGLEHEEYMKICLAMIDACDTVVMLEGYETSVGANTEYDYAQRMDKEIYTRRDK